jgi:hypothetical protein
MTTEVIPFGDIQQSGLDSLSGASPSAMNAVLDERGTMRRRPGITATATGLPSAATVDAVTLGAPIIGLHEAATGDLFGVFGTSVMEVTGAGAVVLAPPALSTVTSGARPIFAETEMLVVLAQSTDIRKIEKLAGSPAPLGLLGGSPPIASHVVANASRLVANDIVIDRTKERYSEVALGTVTYAGHEVWTPGANSAGFFTAEARPDPVVAHAENTNEVFVWGTETTQIYSSDPALVFAPSRSLEVGCCAPYSVVKADSEFYWLDHKRRFVRSGGQGVEPISGPIQSVLKAMTTVSDCYGYRVEVGQVSCLVWTFPTDSRTFVYQPGVGWGQWAGWDAGTANWTAFTVTAHHQRLSDAVNIVGTGQGKLGAFDTATTTDLGVAINAYIETGFIDHGTSLKKQCKCVRFTLRRGTTVSATNPRALLWYRDKPGSWEGPIEIELGYSGDYEAVVPFRNLGIYRMRQWRFQFDGSEELILVRAEEDFTVLGS